MKIFYDTPSVKLYEGVAQQLDLIPDNSVDLAVTSPPYNIKTGNGGAWKVNDWYSDDMPEPEYQNSQILALNEMFRVAKEGGSLFYNCKIRQREKRGIHPWTWISKSEWQLVQQITWNRKSTHNHTSGFMWPHDELIFWMVKGNTGPFFNQECAKFSTVWSMNFEVNSWHPAPFPITIPERCILACSKEGDTVLDPFSGSGTTVKAAQDLHRIGIGVDKSLEYLEKSKLRLAQQGM
jgi:modification methylase